MICRNCGKITPDDQPVCQHCGADPADTGNSRDAATRIVPVPDTGPARAHQPSDDAAQTVPPQSSAGGSGSPESAAMTDEEHALRTTLAGRYEILRRLGSGGMATVYLAHEVALDRDVAIKVLPRAFVRDAAFVKRFKTEAQIAANLEHPCIIRIHQIAEAGELVYFVMSFIPGGNLTDHIRDRKPIPVDDIVRWGMQICDALEYGHHHGVVHRDLKPDNVMIDRNGDAVVMDYGIARAGQGSGLTQAGSVIGTPQYMSPEQARGMDIDRRSDIYSMGVMFYQMATGDLPFTATDAASLMYMHVHESPAPPDARNADVPGWLRNIILKCLAKNPADRFQTAEELKSALGEQLTPKLTTTPSSGRGGKSRMMVAAIATVAILAVVAGGWYLMQRAERARVVEQERIEQERAAAEERDRAAVDAAARDDAAFAQARTAGTSDAYTTYRMLYPDGRHTAEADSALTAFAARVEEGAESSAVDLGESVPEPPRNEAEDVERRRQETEEARLHADDIAWSQALIAASREAFRTYQELYPDGRHVAEASARLDSLDIVEAERRNAAAAEAARRDDGAWRVAHDAGTREAYNTYLISFPDGDHAGEAQSMIATIDAREAEDRRVEQEIAALGIRMVGLPAVTFAMGSQGGGGDERPVRTVTLSAYRMSVTEITQGQYQAVMGGNPSFFKLDDVLPVERVSWYDAAAFCNRLSEQIGLDPCYDLVTGACNLSKNGFRLPTEAEWECACRAGTALAYNLGDGESALDRAGWYRRNSQETTHAVGQKAANAWGLSDMHGNIREWCNDWYAEHAYADPDSLDPMGLLSGSERVIRGGSWLDGPDDCRSTTRRSQDPEDGYSDIGFRIVRR